MIDHQRGEKPLDGFGALISIEHKKVTGCARKKLFAQSCNIPLTTPLPNRNHFKICVTLFSLTSHFQT